MEEDIGLRMHESACLEDPKSYVYDKRAAPKNLLRAPSSRRKPLRITNDICEEGIGAFMRFTKSVRSGTYKVTGEDGKFWILRGGGKRARKKARGVRWIWVPAAGRQERAVMKRSPASAKVGDVILARARDNFDRSRRFYLYAVKRLKGVLSRLEDMKRYGRDAAQLAKGEDVPSRIQCRIQGFVIAERRLRDRLPEFEAELERRREELEKKEAEMEEASNFQWACSRPLMIWTTLMYRDIETRGYGESPAHYVAAYGALLREISLFIPPRGG